MLLEDHDNWLGRFLIPAEQAIQAILYAFDDESPWVLESRRQVVAVQSDRLLTLWTTYPEVLKGDKGDCPTVESLLASVAAHLEFLGQTPHPNSGGCAVCGGELCITPASAVCTDCTISGVPAKKQVPPPWGESCPSCGGLQIVREPERRFCLHCLGPVLPAVRGLRSRFHTGMI